MTTSSLFHLFGLQNQRVISTKYTGGEAICKVETKKDKLQCSVCSSRNVKKAGTVLREFKSVPIGFKTIKLQINIQRLKCKDSGKTVKNICLSLNTRNHILDALKTLYLI